MKKRTIKGRLNNVLEKDVEKSPLTASGIHPRRLCLFMFEVLTYQPTCMFLPQYSGERSEQFEICLPSEVLPNTGFQFIYALLFSFLLTFQKICFDITIQNHIKPFFVVVSWNLIHVAF